MFFPQRLQRQITHSQRPIDSNLPEVIVDLEPGGILYPMPGDVTGANHEQLIVHFHRLNRLET